MPSSAVATRRTTTHTIARPLKILVPLIQQDLEHGNRAGMEYYAAAGSKLLEAKAQVAHGYWGTWLSKNFNLNDSSARRYMRYAVLYQDAQNGRGTPVLPESLSAMRGDTERRRQQRAHEQPFRAVLEELDTDLFAQEKQTRDEEIRLHRDLAIELVDLGFKALASRLHSDRGGSDEAMKRLNRVRSELKGIAKTRRYI
jgi:hypothetical protein